MTLMRSLNGLEPFDLLFRNFFDNESFFTPLVNSKPNYPVDIYENEDGLHLDIAIVGLDENDINIEVTDGDTLRVSHKREDSKPKDEDRYIIRGITKRSFSFGWKVSKKFDLNKIEAMANNGLLSIFIPCSPEAKPKTIKIKPKTA